MRLRALLASCLLVLAGCAGAPPRTPDPAPAAAPAADEAEVPAPGSEPAAPAGTAGGYSIDGDLLYDLLVAEMAGRNGRLDLALGKYLDVMGRSADPRVAERATRIAVYVRDNAAAARAAQRWIDLEPDSGEARQVMASLYLRNNDTDRAYEQLGAMVTVNPEGPAAGMEQVAALLAREQQAAASLAVMRRLVQRFPDEPVGWRVLAQTAIRAGEREESLAALDQAITLRPDYEEALLLKGRVLFSMGRSEPAFAVLAGALKNNPDAIELRLGYARLLVQARHFERASEQFDELSRRNPDNHDLLYTLGLLAIESQRFNEATRYLERLLELGSRTSEANYYLGRIAENQLRYSDAIRYYLRVSDGDSRLDAQVRTAVMLGKLGRVDEARQHLGRLRSQYAEPEQQVRFVRAEGEILRDARRYEDAYQVLTQGLEISPGDGDLLYLRALVAERLDRLDQFEADLRAVLASEPDNGHAYNALGYFLADRTERLDEAQALLDRAISLLPDDPAVIDSVGWLKYRQGDFEGALRWLRRAHERLADPEIAAHLGEVLWVIGDRVEANAVWDRALEASPDDQLLKDVIRRFRQ